MPPQQPQPQVANTSADGFKPKWRHFSPMARVWVQNPFDHDVVFQVADEYNRPFKYRLPSHKVSELPGGAIATLGVKAIVDELIQNNKADEMLMWDESVRSKHEEAIILRLKETTPVTDAAKSGEIDLSVKDDPIKDSLPAPATEEPETAFPGLNDNAADAPDPEAGTGRNYPDPLPAGTRGGLDSVIAASLPSTDAVTTPNNAHDTAEG